MSCFYDMQSGNLFFLRRKGERISGIASKMLACGVKYAKKTAPAGAAFFLERDKVSPRYDTYSGDAPFIHSALSLGMMLILILQSARGSWLTSSS